MELFDHIGLTFSWANVALLVVATFIAGVVPMVIGFGGGLALVAIYSFVLTPDHLIPVVAVVMVATHLVRLLVLHRQVAWHYVGFFSIGMLPGAILGSYLFVLLPMHVIAKTVGMGLIFFSVTALFKPTFTIKARLKQFVPIGLATGLVSAVIGGAGPVTAPFLLGCGFVGAAFTATSIVMQLVAHITKVVSYASFGVLHAADLVLGCCLSLVIVPAVFFGQWLMKRISPNKWRQVVLLALLLIGVRFWFI